MVSAAAFNCRGPSSSPGSTEHITALSCDIATLLSTTNDGRGGMPNQALWSASCVSAKTQEYRGGASNEKPFVLATVVHKLIALST